MEQQDGDRTVRDTNPDEMNQLKNTSSASFYEALEDGFIPEEKEILATQFKPAPDGAALQQLLHDHSYAKKMVREASTDDNQSAWRKIEQVAWERYVSAWNSEQYAAERKRTEELDSARLDISINE